MLGLAVGNNIGSGHKEFQLRLKALQDALKKSVPDLSGVLFYIIFYILRSKMNFVS